MRWVRNFWYYYSQIFICMVILYAFLIGVIVLLLVENKKQRDTILKLNLEIIDLKYKPKQDLVPRKKCHDCFDYRFWDRERGKMR